MNVQCFENQTFERIDYTKSFTIGDYENCIFLNCNFYSTDLSNSIFRKCTFIHSDLSLVTMKDVVLDEITYRNCKLLGSRFDQCNNFLMTVNFDNCLLKLAIFHKLRLKKTRFENCDLQEVDFSETDLAESVFDNCNLQNAIFRKSHLEKVNFRSSYNYQIDPEENFIEKAKFSFSWIGGLLGKYNIEIQ